MCFALQQNNYEYNKESTMTKSKVEIDDLYKTKLEKLELENKLLTKTLENLKRLSESEDRELVVYMDERDALEESMYNLVKIQETQIQVTKSY